MSKLTTPDHPIEQAHSGLRPARTRSCQIFGSRRWRVRLTPAARSTHAGGALDSRRRRVRLTAAARSTHGGSALDSRRQRARFRAATRPPEAAPQ